MDVFQMLDHSGYSTLNFLPFLIELVKAVFFQLDTGKWLNSSGSEQSKRITDGASYGQFTP